jgi:hypothetical protein
VFKSLISVKKETKDKIHRNEVNPHTYLGTAIQGDQMSLLKKSPKLWPKPFLSKLLRNIYFTREKSKPKWCATYVFEKTVQRKQSAKRRKFAQSGHTAAILVFNNCEYYLLLLARMQGQQKSQLWAPNSVAIKQTR